MIEDEDEEKEKEIDLTSTVGIESCVSTGLEE